MSHRGMEATPESISDNSVKERNRTADTKILVQSERFFCVRASNRRLLERESCWRLARCDAINLDMIRYTLVASPIDELLLVAEGDAVVSLFMENHRGKERNIESSWRRDDHDPLLKRAAAQLEEYFARRRIAFDLPLRPSGTEFQKRVWDALLDIPFGQTLSYGEMARNLGDVNASRAVGLANGRNPISILIPCHRVIGANGALTGFGGGIERKRFLLQHEGAIELVASLFETADGDEQ